MSAQRKMNIRGFFTSVRKSHHLANLRVQTFADEQKAASELRQREQSIIYLDNLR